MQVFLAILTFLLAFLGPVFETVQKDQDGKKVPGLFGFSKLTPWGIVWVVLLLSSLGGSWLNARSSAKNASEDKAALGKANKSLDETKQALEEERTRIEKDFQSAEQTEQQSFDKELTREEDHVKIISSDFDKVLAEQTTNTGQITKNIYDTAEVADRKVQGSHVSINSFTMDLFFIGMDLDTLDAFGGKSKKLSGARQPVELIEAIARQSRVPTRWVDTRVPVADLHDTHIDVSSTIGGTGNQTQSVTYLRRASNSPGDDNFPDAVLTSWIAERYGPAKNDRIEFTGSTRDAVGRRVLGRDEGAAPIMDHLTAASFSTQRIASIQVNVADESRVDEASQYFRASLPKIIGFRITPNEVRSANLDSIQSFALYTERRNNNTLEYVYIPVSTLPSWLDWASYDVRTPTETVLPNRYLTKYLK